MKKLSLLICMALLMGGCVPETSEEQQESSKYGNFTIRVIDSCEYIEYSSGMLDQRVYGITHKGNCRFCASRLEKQ